jgi:uncharacterized protein YfbU (UPF0304 family)
MSFYLDKILKLNGKYYEWNEKMREITGITGNSYGVIAQEVQKEFPEMVKREEDGYLVVDYIQLIPVMIEAIKELKLELDSLKKEV